MFRFLEKKNPQKNFFAYYSCIQIAQCFFFIFPIDILNYVSIGKVDSSIHTLTLYSTVKEYHLSTTLQSEVVFFLYLRCF